MTGRQILALGAVLAGIAVATGAFGAHMLRPRLSERMMEVFETGVRYHMFHSLALLFSGWALTQFELGIFRKAALAFVVGIVIFSGSLYVLALSDTRWLGAMTPIGGVLFLTGWVCLAIGFLRLP
ncbi:MAG: DUF423 domain-containing protein [Nitrospirae bacterium]|nr:DUF423 domain-containing protein [Nitrospirota bacterium]MDA1303015.1 DUF423 domain-containing protein [Nitrospirota bacterium]